MRAQEGLSQSQWPKQGEQTDRLPDMPTILDPAALRAWANIIKFNNVSPYIQHG